MNTEQKNRKSHNWYIKNCIKVFIVFNVITLVFILSTFEIALRILNIGYENAPLISDPLIHHKHAKNYTFYSYSSNGSYGNFLVHYDDERLVSNPFATRKKDIRNSAIRIAFMGDSFVEGGQVKYDEHFKPTKEYQAGNNRLFFDNDIHFNANGHKVIAKKIMKKFPELFR